jgi:hypothetical protein
VAHLYEAAVQTASLSTVTAVATVLAAAGQRAEVRELSVFANVSSVACNIGFGVPAANGTGAATGSLVQAVNPDDVAGVTTLVTSFATTQPTAPAVFTRQYRLSALTGTGVYAVWEPGELIVPASGQFVVWLLAGTATFDVSVKAAE